MAIFGHQRGRCYPASSYSYRDRGRVYLALFDGHDQARASMNPDDAQCLIDELQAHVDATRRWLQPDASEEE